MPVWEGVHVTSHCSSDDSAAACMPARFQATSRGKLAQQHARSLRKVQDASSYAGVGVWPSPGVPVTPRCRST